MRITEILNMILPFVYVLVFIAIIWFVVELVMLVRKTRGVVDDVHKKIEPTLDHIEKITAELEPVVPKIDPLVDRVSLTVDAANLEIMRLDQILEDVTEITDTVSSAATAVDTAANAPIELVSNVTSKIRKAFKPSRASSESIALGEKKVSESAQEAVQGIKEAVAEQGAEQQKRKEAREEASQEKKANEQALNEAAQKVGISVLSSIDESSFPGTESKKNLGQAQEDSNEGGQYFTYGKKRQNKPRMRRIKQLKKNNRRE
ncbi:MAG: DUF948 domain-containing protein [Raoultibacter sp.]|jgi:uncharacterized protein YoxC